MPLLLAFLLTFLTLNFNSASTTTAQVSPSPAFFPTPTMTVVPTSKILSYPSPTSDTTPWGIAKQTGEHTYQIRIQNDSQMGSPDEILSALNALRIRNGVQALIKDQKLCDYTNSRAELFSKLKGTDEHKGFTEFLNNQDGFKKLGYGAVGENSSYGYVMSGVHLIEFVYMQSPQHNANQLNPDWDHGCAGTSGSATNLIFATSPI